MKKAKFTLTILVFTAIILVLFSMRKRSVKEFYPLIKAEEKIVQRETFKKDSQFLWVIKKMKISEIINSGFKKCDRHDEEYASKNLFPAPLKNVSYYHSDGEKYDGWIQYSPKDSILIVQLK